MATRLRLAMLGGFELRTVSGTPVPVASRKGRALLAYLALSPGMVQPREKLATLLWGGAGDQQARSSLRQSLAGLRASGVDERTLRTAGQTLGLDPTAMEVDALEFERLAAQTTVEALERAAALYRGDLLEGLAVREAAFEEWLRVEQERLRGMAIDALQRLLAQHAWAGSLEPGIRSAARLLALDPLQEGAHRALMSLYVRQGRRAAALRQYHICAAALRREVGAEPEAETRELYRAIVQGRPVADPVRPAPRPRTATAGGGPAAPLDAPLVGREAETAALRSLLDEPRARLALVTGGAGAGKSRLARWLVREAARRGSRALAGTAREGERVLPFALWVDLLRHDLTADPALLRGLDRVWRTELARLFPDLGGAAPELSTGPERHVRLFEAVVRLLDHLARDRALVLVLEDLHWADEVSLALLAFALRRLADRPVLVLGTARDEELPDATTLRQSVNVLAEEGRAVRLALAPLGREATVALVRALAPGADADRVAAEAWRLGAGNPLVAVEVARAAGAEPAAAVPERVRRLVRDQLDRLTERCRQVLGVLAAAGGALDFALLERAVGLPAADTAGAVEELAGRRLLRVAGDRLECALPALPEVLLGDLLAPHEAALRAAVARAADTAAR